MGNDLKEILVTAEDMDRRLGDMAAEIDRDYAGEELLIVGVLRGAVMVMADLSRKLHTPLEMDWMAVSSYGSGTKTPASFASSRTSTRMSPGATS